VRHCTPPDEKGFPVFVPAGTAERATDALASIPAEERVRWASHRVRRGETLSQIAQHYGTSVQAIMEANRLRDARQLSIGRDLVVPEGRAHAAAPPQLAASTSERKSASSGSASGNKMVYVVKRGDTLSEIAERHGTSPRELRRWNRIGRFIYPGQRLSIYSSGTSPSGARARASGDYTVKVARGDTLWRIAKAHGVSLMSLLRANNLKRAEVIKPGDLIRVPRS
jgi:membrane-bound lytic murein transglycosylase D